MYVRCWDCGQEIEVPESVKLNMRPESLLNNVASALMIAYNTGANTWDGLARVAIATIERYNNDKKHLHKY